MGRKDLAVCRARGVDVDSFEDAQSLRRVNFSH